MISTKGFGVVNNIRRGTIYNPSDRRLVGSVQERLGQITNGDRTALGNRSGSEGQQEFAVAIGYDAAHYNQSSHAIAIGTDAGHDSQSVDAVAIGHLAGEDTQGGGAVAVGYSTGTASQGANSVAVGATAGQTGLGTNSIAIGSAASQDGGSFGSTIVLNASGIPLNPPAASSFYAKPVAQDTATDSGANPFANNLPTGFNVTLYNPTTGEFRYWNPA